MTDDERETLEALGRFIAAYKDYCIQIDGRDLQSPKLRRYTQVAVDNGWLQLGDLVEGDQWSWYEAKITEAGKQAVAELEKTP